TVGEQDGTPQRNAGADGSRPGARYAAFRPTSRARTSPTWWEEAMSEPKPNVVEWTPEDETPENIVPLARAKKRRADQPALPNVGGGFSLEDIFAYRPTHSFIYVPSREMWSAASIDARIPPISNAAGKAGESLKASKWLASNRPIEQMTWAPGEPMLIEN